MDADASGLRRLIDGQVELDAATRRSVMSLINQQEQVERAARETAQSVEQSNREQARSYEMVERQVSVIRAQLDPYRAAQDRLNRELAEYNALAAQGHLTTRELAQATDMAQRSFQQTAVRLGVANDNIRLTRQQMLGLGYQVNDVATMLLMGASPFQIMASQGGQVLQVLQDGPGGVRGSLKAVGAQAVGLAARFAPVGLAIGAAALAVKGMQSEINATSDVMVSFGDVAMAIPQLIGSAIYDFLQPAIEAIAPWFATAWDIVKDGVRDVGNFIIREFAAQYEILKATIQSVVPAFIVAGEAAANGFITAINWMVEKAVSGINTIIEAANDLVQFLGGDAIAKELGFDITIGTIEAPELGELDLGGQKAVEDLDATWKGLRETLGEIADTDFMGRIFGAIQQQAIENATKRLEENEEALKKVKQEMEGFIDLADRLAEEMFPGNAAAAEAADLLDLMSRFGDKLTDIQRIAVEARIDEMFMASALGVRELTEETNRAGKSLAKAMDPVKDFFDGLLDVLYSSGDAFEKLISLGAEMGKKFAQMGLDRIWQSITGVGAGSGTTGRGTGSFIPEMAGGARAWSPVQSQTMGREIGNAIAPSITSSLNDNLSSFAAAIRKIESGSYAGNYSAQGPIIRSGSYAGDRAYGAYQVMGNNIASWTKEVLGHSLTISEFVADRAAQDAVFFKKFGASVDKFGSFADGASVWFSGRPLSRAGNSSDGYNTVPQYVQKAEGALAGYPGGLKAGVSDGMVDANRRLANSTQAPAAASAPGVAGQQMQDMLGIGGAAFGAFAGGMQSGNPLMGGISGAMSGLGAAPMLANAFPALGAMATPLAVVGGAVLGIIGGLIGRARQKRQELKQAQQELESQMGAITELIATATGNFMGTFEKTVMSTADEFSKAIAMANKAKNQELVDELTAAQDEFFDRMTDRWERGFEGMIASMEAGLGLDGEFMAGMDSVEKMRESLVGFVNDARLFVDAEGDLASVIKNRKDRFNAGDEEEIYRFAAEYNPGSNDAGALVIQNDILEGYKALGDQIADLGVQAYTKTGGMLYDSLEALRNAAEAAGLAIDEMGVVTEAAVDPNANLADQVERAQKAAQATALAMISGAEEFTAMEEAVQKINGTVAGMNTLLEDLGMSAEEAATAIDLHLNIAMAKLRDAYRDELNSSINDLSGFGFINEIMDAQDRYDERLQDAAVLGLDSGLALRELNLALADIVETSDLTQAQIDMLAAAFPAMAGLIETVAGKDAMQIVQDAEAALRSAYEEQRREIEATISRLENFTDRIKEFRDEMRLSASSPLGQRDQMEEALKQFRETAALA
ncbi:phage tail length tape measure family protein, partial [Mesorhizobium sp. CAU 1741]|uniref:phage tail length tape measure family protein n=1 Tax=Mesorhizobium sp. CAU 1741 TaxID=3140366 RepID=UPI00325BC983